MMDTNALHNAIAAVAPINGVSIVDEADRATWRIDFRDEATALQRLAALDAVNLWQEPAEVPSVHAAWLRAALAEVPGRLEAVNTAVASAGPVKQQIWDFATSVRMDHPDVVAVATALHIDLPAVFARAEELRAEFA